MRKILVIVLGVILAACSSTPTTPQQTGPVLLEEVVLEPTIPVPTRILSPTPSRPAPTSEVQSPLEIVTIQADFVLVTPTLPPSKTPTSTPTITYTPTITPSPTVTVTATATRPLFPTSVIIPITADAAVPLPQICNSTWFFLTPAPGNCPLSPPIASQGVYQAFENGYMVWVGSQDAIYVMYNDGITPRWQFFRDSFAEGMAEDDPAYGSAPRPNTWQPRRGFGMLWRNNQVIRDRIGWATIQFEQPFSVQTQVSADGTLFVSEPSGGVFGLAPNGVSWQRYLGYNGF